MAIYEGPVFTNDWLLWYEENGPDTSGILDERKSFNVFYMFLNNTSSVLLMYQTVSVYIKKINTHQSQLDSVDISPAARVKAVSEANTTGGREVLQHAAKYTPLTPKHGSSVSQQSEVLLNAAPTTQLQTIGQQDSAGGEDEVMRGFDQVIGEDNSCGDSLSNSLGEQKVPYSTLSWTLLKVFCVKMAQWEWKSKTLVY